MQNTDRDGSVFAHITRLDAVDSTNRHCRLLAKEGAPHGTVLIAQAQTAGRGRRGRDWQSPAGCGLWLSVLLRPDVDGSAYPLFSLAAALAVAEACEEVTGAQMGIKWPNDVVLMGKKIAGILVEREGEAVVVGMGINVRQRPEDFPAELRATAGSLEMLTDCPVDMQALENAVLGRLARRAHALDPIADFDARCVTIGARVRVILPDRAYTGVAEGITANGALLVRDDMDNVNLVMAGDVSVRGIMGYV